MKKFNHRKRLHRDTTYSERYMEDFEHIRRILYDTAPQEEVKKVLPNMHKEHRKLVAKTMSRFKPVFHGPNYN